MSLLLWLPVLFSTLRGYHTSDAYSVQTKGQVNFDSRFWQLTTTELVYVSLCVDCTFICHTIEHFVWAANFACLYVYVWNLVRVIFSPSKVLSANHFCAQYHRVPKIESRCLFVSLCCWFKFLAHQLSSMIFVSLCFCAVVFFPTPIEQWGFF